MITGVVRLQLAVFLVLTLVGISIAAVTYVGVDLDDERYVVRADFADAAGIFDNAVVTYRGVTVGRVEDLRPTRTGVEVALRMDADAKVPADTDAVIANRSAVGEQYVDLRPRRAGAPYLADGSTIPRSRTSVPVSTTTLLYDLDRLVDSVPKDDLVTVIEELGTAFGGTGDDLGRLIDSGNALLETADANLEQTIGLLEHGRTVLDTQRRSGSAIESFAKDLADLSGTLADSDPQLRTVLHSGVRTAEQVKALVDENRSDVPVLLGNLVSTAQVVEARLDGVQHILILYPYVVRGGYTVIAKDPVTGHYTSHFGLQLSLGPRACREGYEDTEQRQPDDTSGGRGNPDARCTDEETTMRGAQNAPEPQPEGGTDPDDDRRRPTPRPDPPHSEGSEGSEGSDGDRAGRDVGDTDDQGERSGLLRAPLLAPYDPLTGRVELPDGTTTRIGSRGGQQRVFGEDSWKWLLIGPLSGEAR
ncbi:MAG TPA: MlaD family protein [Actinopolymorphaceae bacterium]